MSFFERIRPNVSRRTTTEDDEFVERLAYRFLRWNIFILFALIAIVAFAIAYDTFWARIFTRGAATESAVNLLTVLLPVIGTWVGTVLTFFFSEKNFKEAKKAQAEAQQNLMKLAGKEAETTSVRELMIGFGEIKGTITLKDKDVQSATIASVAKSFEEALQRDSLVNRVLFVSPGPSQGQGIFAGILHRSVWDEVRTVVADQAIGLDFSSSSGSGSTLKDVWDLELPSRPGTRFGDVVAANVPFLPRAATLAGAKAAFETGQGAEDAFVTQNGSAEEPILGWITNKLLLDYLKP